jgi:hypothetical protein
VAAKEVLIHRPHERLRLWRARWGWHESDVRALRDQALDLAVFARNVRRNCHFARHRTASGAHR